MIYHKQWMLNAHFCEIFYLEYDIYNLTRWGIALNICSGANSIFYFRYTVFMNSDLFYPVLKIRWQNGLSVPFMLLCNTFDFRNSTFPHPASLNDWSLRHGLRFMHISARLLTVQAQYEHTNKRIDLYPNPSAWLIATSSSTSQA